LTITPKSRAEEGSGTGGVCQLPQGPSRWVQGLALPIQCFTCRLTVHQEPGAPVYGYSFEIADPHTKELLAQVVEPARRYSEVLHLCQQVTLDVRAVLLHLTDPDPF